MQPPGPAAGEPPAAPGVGDRAAQTQRGGAGRRARQVLGDAGRVRAAVQRDQHIGGQQLGLGEGVLGVRRARRPVRVRVGHGRTVPGGPCPGQRAAVRAEYLEGGQTADPAGGVQREVGVAQ